MHIHDDITISISPETSFERVEVGEGETCEQEDIVSNTISQSQQINAVAVSDDTFISMGEYVDGMSSPLHIFGGHEPSEFVVNNGENGDPWTILSKLKAKNREILIIGHININFLDKKFESLVSLFKDNVDIILISETKVDESFPISQFTIEGYRTPIRLDRNCHGGGLIFYLRDDIPCKEIKSHMLPKSIEGIFVEVTLRKTKWLLLGGYNPHRDNISFLLFE